MMAAIRSAAVTAAKKTPCPHPHRRRLPEENRPERAAVKTAVVKAHSSAVVCVEVSAILTTMKNDLDKFWYEVEFSFAVAVATGEIPEPSNFVHKISGAVIQQDRMEDALPIKIGCISLVPMDVDSGIDAGYSAFDIVDSFDAESAEYGQVLFDVEGDVAASVVEQFESAGWIGRVLILEVVKIDPEFRGRNVGLLAARHAIELFGHSAFIILRPFPLQFNRITKRLHRQHRILGGCTLPRTYPQPRIY
jgi:hypothetical protein